MEKVLNWVKAHKIWSAVIAVFVIGSIGAATDSSETSSKDDKEPASVAKDDPKADEKSDASKEPEPKPEPLTPLEQLQEAADDTDADDVKVEKKGKSTYLVTFKVGDNFSDGTIRTGIARNVFDLAEELDDTDVPIKEVAFRGTFPLTDKYGDTEDGQVFYTTFTGKTIGKINYDDIIATQFDNIENLAIDNWVSLHQDLR